VNEALVLGMQELCQETIRCVRGAKARECRGEGDNEEKQRVKNRTAGKARITQAPSQHSRFNIPPFSLAM
jgi:hypothetical protein